MFIIQQLALCGWILHRLLKRSSDRAVNKLPLKKKITNKNNFPSWSRLFLSAVCTPAFDPKSLKACNLDSILIEEMSFQVLHHAESSESFDT